MPTPGLSLLGFLDQPAALVHLRNSCVVGAADDAALTQVWSAARAALGAPIVGAGQPDIQPLSPLGVQHHAAMMQVLEIQQLFNTVLAGGTLVMVEIEPLLAFQMTIDVTRSQHHNGGVLVAPTENELLNMCLPLGPAQEQIQMIPAPESLLVKTRGLNFHVQGQGFMHGSFIGLQVGVSVPFSHVVRHQGRCFLHNGFHRALALRSRGATHMPCVFRDVGDYAAVGIRPGSTFEPALLESANPPTLGHFTQGRAHSIQLKTLSRTLHVSWAEYVTTED